MGFSPVIYALKNLYREKRRAALTDVKISADEIAAYRGNRVGAAHVMLPGMKQRMEVPRGPLMGQTIVLRFASQETLVGRVTSFYEDSNALRVS